MRRRCWSRQAKCVGALETVSFVVSLRVVPTLTQQIMPYCSNRSRSDYARGRNQLLRWHVGADGTRAGTGLWEDAKCAKRPARERNLLRHVRLPGLGELAYLISLPIISPSFPSFLKALDYTGIDNERRRDFTLIGCAVYEAVMSCVDPDFSVRSVRSAHLLLSDRAVFSNFLTFVTLSTTSYPAQQRSSGAAMTQHRQHRTRRSQCDCNCTGRLLASQWLGFGGRNECAT
jgi:hypothetical protein